MPGAVAGTSAGTAAATDEKQSPARGLESIDRAGEDGNRWRIPAHSVARLSELLPHNWKPLASPGAA